jgi:transketolase
MEGGAAMNGQPLSARAACRIELTRLAHEDRRVVCIDADLGGATNPFATAHPDRHLNLGVAEAAAVDIAVGLASAGLRPYVHTFAPFAALRAAESVKLGLGYLGAPIVLVCPYGGVAGGWFGTTHHALEDLAVVRSLPGVRVAVPCGEAEARAVIRQSLAAALPCYVRLGRNEVHVSPIPPLAWGEVGWLRGPADGGVTLVSVGEKPEALCAEAVSRAPWLGHARLCWVDDESLRRAAPELGARCRELVVVEEHREAGSVASALALMLPDIRVRAVNAGTSWPTRGGGHDDVLAQLNLTVEAVLTAASADVDPKPALIGSENR